MSTVTRRAFLFATAAGMLGARPAPARTPDETTVIGLLHDPSMLDPRKVLDMSSRMIVAQVYDSLLRQLRDMSIVAGVAESCEPDRTDKQNRTWIVRVRNGLRFQDGEPLDTSAARYSIEQSAPHRFPTVLDRVEIIDNTFLRVVTKEPYGPLRSRFCDVFVVPPRYYDPPENVLSGTLLHRPNGSGEYVLREYVPNSHIVLERFEGYSGKKPVVKRLVYRVISDKKGQVEAKKAGDIDITADPPKTDFAEQLKQAGIPAAEGLGSIVFLGLNTQVLADPRVRVALGLALDRQAIAALQGGIVTDLVFAAEATAGPKDAPPWPRRDVDRAAQLLRQAGFKGELVVAAYGDLYVAAEAVAAQWKSAGINARPERVELQRLREALLKKQPPEAYLVRRSVELWDPDPVLSAYVASQGPFSTYKNPEADNLIMQGRSELRPEVSLSCIASSWKV